MNLRPLAALLLCTLAWTAVRADEAPLVIPVEGEPFRAPFVGADSTWALTFGAGPARRSLPAADVAAWGNFVEPGRGTYVFLAGGGLIVAEGVHIAEEHVVGRSAIFGALKLPLELVSGIVLRPPSDRAALDKLLWRVLSPEPGSDRALLDNGDELSGSVTVLDAFKAVLKTDADPVDLRRDTLWAITFDPTLVDRPRASGLRAVVGFRDGSRVTALEMITEKKETRLKVAGGLDLAAPTASIVALQVFGGRAGYLSDLKPSSYRHLPFLQLTWPYQADRSVLGAQLRAGGKLFLKGLGMHSPSRITYDLDGDYRKFEAQAAIDDETRGRGSVEFRVFVDDGDGQWQERAKSGILRGAQPPHAISVDLAGIKRISLLVDFTDRGDELDHADWLNARLIK